MCSDRKSNNNNILGSSKPQKIILREAALGIGTITLTSKATGTLPVSWDMLIYSFLIDHLEDQLTLFSPI